jgi:hypothetical protein
MDGYTWKRIEAGRGTEKGAIPLRHKDAARIGVKPGKNGVADSSVTNCV